MAMNTKFRGAVIFGACGIIPIILSAIFKSSPGALIGSMVVYAFILALIGFIYGKSLSSKLHYMKSLITDIAEGEADLTKRLPHNSNDDLNSITVAFNRFLDRIEDVVSRVKNTSITLDTAIQEVSSGSMGLSESSQQQASSVEEVAATIEEMTSSIKQTASNADSGRDKTRAMVDVANNTSVISQDLIRRMDEMSEASKKIGDIIVTVNEVAFQTNLLALNAAVEAARAGEHGKGFAVVAEEVRGLAQRSADAARQIKTLIEDTVDKISAGDEMVKKSGESIAEIIAHIEDISQTMDEMAASSSEQASGVDELNRAITQIDSTTQQNASTVEELSSTADNLSVEAKDLTDIVSKFKVSGEKSISAPKRRAADKPSYQPTPVTPVAKPKPEFKPMPTMDFESNDFEEF